MFQNEFGLLNLSASFNIIHNDIIVASIMTVEQAPWYDTPLGPFIIELMVHASHRKQGIGEYLIHHTAGRLAEIGAETVALRVSSDNPKALNLYRKCRFVSYNNVR